MLNNYQINRQDTKHKKNSSVAVDYLCGIMPMHIKTNRKTSCYNQLRQNVYHFLHHPDTLFACIYHILVFLMVFMCLIVTIFTTIKNFQYYSWKVMLVMERIIVVWFASEFLIRFWASCCRQQYRGWRGKFRYFCKPLCVVDLIVIIVSVIVLWLQTNEGSLVFLVSAFRGFHRFFQVIRMVRTERRFTPFRVILSVLYAQREQLLIILYIGVFMLFFASFVIYLVENDVNNQFESIADSFWWAVVTFFTIGYGDKVPVTWLGKLIASLLIIFSVFIFTIPAGIIGAGLAIDVQQEQKNFQRKQNVEPAVRLIQCCWRFYASDPTSHSIATWITPKSYAIQSVPERIAIRFIRLLKLLRAKQSFRSMTATIDIKDVLELNRTGHSNILYRIKELQTDLDTILRKTNAKQLTHELVDSLEEKINQIEETNRNFDKQLEYLNKFLSKN